MNIELIITGLIALLIGLLGQVLDKPRSAREKRDVPLGLSESQFKVSKLTLIIVGIICILYGSFGE